MLPVGPVPHYLKQQMLVSGVLAAAGILAGLYYGAKAGHPVIGFFAGSAAASVVSTLYVFATTPEAPSLPPIVPAAPVAPATPARAATP